MKKKIKKVFVIIEDICDFIIGIGLILCPLSLFVFCFLPIFNSQIQEYLRAVCFCIWIGTFVATWIANFREVFGLNDNTLACNDEQERKEKG